MSISLSSSSLVRALDLAISAPRPPVHSNMEALDLASRVREYDENCSICLQSLNESILAGHIYNRQEGRVGWHLFHHNCIRMHFQHWFLAFRGRWNRPGFENDQDMPICPICRTPFYAPVLAADPVLQNIFRSIFHAELNRFMWDFEPQQMSSEVYHQVLEVAADRGRFDVVKNLLRHRTPLESSRYRVIHCLVRHERFDLLNKFAADQRFSQSICNCLEQAVQNRDEATVQILLAHGKIPLVVFCKFLEQAVQNRDEVMVRISRAYGQTPPLLLGKLIYCAVTLKSPELVKLLLENGKISQDLRGAAIKRAHFYGEWEILKMLLQSGAITDKCRGDLVGNLIFPRNLEVFNLVLASGKISLCSREMALSSACRHDQFDIMKALLRNGPISQKFREELLFVFAIGETSVLSEILASGEISPQAHALAVHQATLANRLENIALLKGYGSAQAPSHKA